MVRELAPDVYELPVTDDDPDRTVRAYLFDDADGSTLVDAGLESTTDALFAGLDELGASPDRVIVTHYDGDHVGGLPAVAERFNPTVYLPEPTEEAAVALPDDADVRAYGDGDAVGPFEAVRLPGHCPENHGLVDSDRGVAVAGDAVSGSDQRGLPAGYPILPPAVFSDDLNRAEESLERLLDHEFDVLLVFHGSPITDAAGAKLERFVAFPGKP